ncbi:MAG: transcriptional repressor LexA [Candidatus Comchoanobacterales bacterium]
MLTVKQLQVLQYIQNYMSENDYAPTTKEIAQGIGIQSRGVVHRYLKALKEAGHIDLLAQKKRNIVLTAVNTKNQIPILGCIAAGKPLEAIEQDEYLNMEHLFTGANRYALKVKGDSMIEEGIMDGDIAICYHAQVAKNNQIVVALIDQQEVTLKRIQFLKHEIILHSANAKYGPQIYDSKRVSVQGIFIGLIRLD